jgi:hypothetical protein
LPSVDTYPATQAAEVADCVCDCAGANDEPEMTPEMTYQLLLMRPLWDNAVEFYEVVRSIWVNAYATSTFGWWIMNSPIIYSASVMLWKVVTYNEESMAFCLAGLVVLVYMPSWLDEAPRDVAWHAIVSVGYMMFYFVLATIYVLMMIVDGGWRFVMMAIPTGPGRTDQVHQ